MNNQRTEMWMKDIFSRSTLRKKVLNSGWDRIPAITSMNLKLGGINEMLHELGLTRKMPSKFEFKLHEGDSMNRYMKYQLLRMEKFRDAGQARKYWFLAQILMKNSVSFRVSAINHVFKGWYKSMPLKYLFKILNKVDKIVKKNIDDLEYKRVYIPKANGKWRPLGVPTHSWRVVLHMHAAFLSHFLEKVIPSNQHAYRANKGTKTAWSDLLLKIFRYKYIYEIDLKNCFNEINSAWVTEKLKNLGVPPQYYYYIENLNRNVPVFAEKDEIDESVLRDREKIHKLCKEKMPLKETSIYDAFNEMEPENQAVVRQIAEEEDMSLDEYIQVQWALLDSFGPTSIGNSHRGLPQGSGISPILTCLVLSEFTQSAEDSVFYADDGLFMSNKEFEIKSDIDKGIILAPEKCRWIKFNGKWLHPLIFLGMKFWNNKLSGCTRNGSRLEIGGKLDKVLRFLHVFKPEYATMSGIFNKTSLGGLVQNKLYAGSWENNFYETKWTFEGVRNSWLSLKGKRDNYVTTSSIACHALANILRSRKVSFLKPASTRGVPKYVFWNRYKSNGKRKRTK